MIIAGKYEVPDTCPDNCPCREEMRQFSMTSTCFRCPVLNCSGDPEFRPIDPENFREDWAAEWVEFFKTGTYPELRFEISK